MAEQELHQARMGWLPELGLAPEASSVEYTLPLQFSWEIDIWGKIKKAKQAAHSEYLRSTEVQHAVLSSVVAQVATVYYQILLLNRQVVIVDRNRALNDSVLVMLNVQYQLGDVTLPGRCIAIRSRWVFRCICCRTVPM